MSNMLSVESDFKSTTKDFSISIIVTSYNYEAYIKETIESVIAQTFKNWEMIIVDDGSRDNSVEVIKSYCQMDSRIKLFQHENGINKGLSETLQYGISKASGTWIVFLESDDIITSDYLEEKLKIIKHYSEVDFIFNNVNMFGDNFIIEKYNKYFSKQKKYINNLNFPTLLLDNFKEANINLIPTFSCVMCKKELLTKLDFNSPIKPALDYYLWAQLLQNTKFYYIDKKLTNWRMHGNSYINTGVSDFDNFRFEIKLMHFMNSQNIVSKFEIISKTLKFIRQKVIRLHIKDKEIILFGKSFKF